MEVAIHGQETMTPLILLFIHQLGEGGAAGTVGKVT